MGLRTYDASNLKHGYVCEVDGCTANHDSMQPNKSLLDTRIDLQMHDRQ